MEAVSRGLIAFFASVVKERLTELGCAEIDIRPLLSMKSVQKIIIKAMCKIEPIVNTEFIYLSSSRPPKYSNSAISKPKLLTLAEDAKNILSNYETIQHTLSNLSGIIESIDNTPESPNTTHKAERAHPTALMEFLSSLLLKHKTTNYEIEDISEETWSKHLDVEKMLKIELEKYYDDMDKVESKHLVRMNHVKLKAGLKIKWFEAEIAKNWEGFREGVDRMQMVLEDKHSHEIEQYQIEQLLLDDDRLTEGAVDYETAMQKIRGLVSVRRILEKRQLQDERILTSLHNKIAIITEKLSVLQESSRILLENSGSLTWCLEFLIEKSEMPEAVKEKSLKLLNKHKCGKLEALFKTQGILEKYSVKTVSKKFDDLREGIESVTGAVRDERVKSKLNKLIVDSKLKEVDSKKLINVEKKRRKTYFNKNFERNASESSRKSMMPQIKIKPESAIEKMRRVMHSIEEEILNADRAIEVSLQNTEAIRSPSLYDISPIASQTRSKSSKLKVKSPQNLSQRSSKLNLRQDSYTLAAEIPQRSNKETQACPQSTHKTTQITPKLFTRASKLLTASALCESQSIEGLESLLIKSLERFLIETSEKSAQTDKEPSVLDFSTPHQSIVRGLMRRGATKDNLLKFTQNPVEPLQILESSNNQPDPTFNPHVFQTELSPESEEEPPTPFLQKLSENSRTTAQPSRPPPLTLPNSFLKSSLLRPVSDPATNSLLEAAAQYQKELQLQIQLKGYKRLNFQDIQNLWEEVINRRILEGEKDRISLMLRGYLGTDEYESEKLKILQMISKPGLGSTENMINEYSPKLSQKVINRWEVVVGKALNRVLMNFKGNIEETDQPLDILYKAAKSIKYFRHRITTATKQVNRGSEKKINLYQNDKWVVNSMSVSPTEKLKKKSYFKQNALRSKLVQPKTPSRSRGITSETTRLPFI